MASREFWETNIHDKTSMWLKVIGQPEEDEAETLATASKIFAGAKGKSCLEIGAGVGRLLKFALSTFTEVVGVDVSKAITALADSRYRILLTDGLTLPFPDESFDFVYSFTVFQHMPDLATVQTNLKETYRVLRKGGVCRIQTVEGEPNPSLYDGRVFPSSEAFWAEFEQAGFTKVSAETENAWIWITAKK